MKRFVVLLLSCMVVLAGALTWLGGTESGLHSALALAGAASGGRLTVEGAAGRLIGPLSLRHLEWVDADRRLELRELRIDWAPMQLLREHRLQINKLDVHALAVVMTSGGEPTPPPHDLMLPIGVDIPRLGIANLTWNNGLIVRDISAALASDGTQHSVPDMRFAIDKVDVRGQLRVNGQPPLTLDASATATTRIDQNPLALRVNAQGVLERIQVELNGVSGIDGNASITVLPFADEPIARAQADLRGINPARWLSGMPEGDMAVRLSLAPVGKSFNGSFALTNHQPGPVDLGRLPFIALSGSGSGTLLSADINALDIVLAGTGALAGRVSGTGHWNDGQLALELLAQNIDAATLVSKLRPTRLGGAISASLGAERQQLVVSLSGKQLTLQGQASHAADLVEVSELVLASGSSRVRAQGKIKLTGQRSFSTSGELEHFNPAHFSRWPEADINARFSGAGQVDPTLVLQARLELTPSQFAGQPLSGRGEVTMAWPYIHRADIALAHGANTVVLHGAFGKPGDSLALNVQAPSLASYGIQGELHGQATVHGTLDQLTLAGHIAAPRLRIPRLINLDGATLDLAVSPEPDAPLNVSLAIARLDMPGQVASVRDLGVQITGFNRQHRLQAVAVVSDQWGIGLAAEGGFNGAPGARDWRGAITETRLGSQQHAVDAHLVAAAPLNLNPTGWNFGPATLRSSVLDGEISLQATADTKRASLSLSGHSAGSGKIEGRFSAGMLSPWLVAGNLPWDGTLTSDVGDLSWLGGMLGEGWNTQGQIHGEIHLAGSPAQPLVNGQWRGTDLGLTIPAQGLELARGELVMDIADNRLRVSKLGADSVLRAAPKALRLHSPDDLITLTEKPGRLEMSGEMQFDGFGSEQAMLAVELDRFGAWQRDDQWMLISGNSQLNWRARADGMEGGELGLRGQLRADAGYWQLAAGNAPRLGDDVIVKRSGNDAPKTTIRPMMNLDVMVELGDRFLFRGAGLESRLEGGLRLSAKGRDLPRASGRIKSVDGRFQAYGQQLAIERGFLNFEGLPDNPALDIRAVRKGLAVEPGVQITGTVQRPVVKLISDPELPDPEKLAWLVLGHGPDRMSVGDATTLLTAAGGLIGSDSGNLLYQLKQSVGIDELGLRQGELGAVGGKAATTRVAGSSVKAPESASEQIFSIGKRLSSDVMLSYEQSIGTAESVVKLTMNLGRQLSLVGRAGSENALDLFYIINLGQPPSPAPAH